MQAYESEFAEHPDLTATWAASPGFLLRFKEGFDAYLAGAAHHLLACSAPGAACVRPSFLHYVAHPCSTWLCTAMCSQAQHGIAAALATA